MWVPTLIFLSKVSIWSHRKITLIKPRYQGGHWIQGTSHLRQDSRLVIQRWTWAMETSLRIFLLFILISLLTPIFFHFKIKEYYAKDHKEKHWDTVGWIHRRVYHIWLGIPGPQSSAGPYLHSTYAKVDLADTAAKGLESEQLWDHPSTEPTWTSVQLTKLTGRDFLGLLVVLSTYCSFPRMLPMVKGPSKAISKTRNRKTISLFPPGLGCTQSKRYVCRVLSRLSACSHINHILVVL